MINTQTNDFLNALAKLIQESGLPVVNVRLALELMRMQLIEAERAAIEQEKQQAEKAEEKKED